MNERKENTELVNHSEDLGRIRKKMSRFDNFTLYALLILVIILAVIAIILLQLVI